MNNGKSHRSLLDTLRAQSEAVQGQGDAARRPVEEALKETDRRLWRAFKWLDEAVRHLEVIKPIVAHEFRLGEVLTIASPKFETGFLSFRRRPLGGEDVIDQIELFYRLVLDKPIVVKVPPAASAGVEAQLRGSQLVFEYRTEIDEKRVARQSIFIVQPAVTAMIRLLPDYRRQTVEVLLRNIDRFEAVTLEFPSDAIEEPALEDLVRFILGEANTFLRRAPLAGVGAGRRPVDLKGPEVYRVEKTIRQR
jgi:hypothetical protein